MTVAQMLGLAPFAILVLGAGLIAAIARVLPVDGRVARWLAAIIAAAAGVTAALAGAGDEALGGAMRRDAATACVATLIAVATAASFALDASAHRAIARPAVPIVVTLLAAAGGVLLVSSADLVLMLAALVVLFMSLVMLVTRAASAGAPGASRVLLVSGGTATVLFAAGAGIVWWTAGSSAVGALAGASGAGLSGVAFVLVGLAYFTAAVPLQGWLVSAVASLPSPTALFVATVPRIAALAALLRCAGAVTTSSEVDWRAFVAVLAAVTMIVGSTAALSETSLRRAVAWLSVAYVGQVLVGAAGLASNGAVAFALGALVPMLVGVFAVLASLATSDASVADLRGLARSRPLLTGALGILLFGLAGIPPTAGFFARLAIFESAVDAQLAWLLFVAALGTVAMAATAARITFAALDARGGRATRSRTQVAIAAACALLVLLGGVVPGPLLELARGVRF